MRGLRILAGLLAVLVPAMGADVTGQVVITHRLTKKKVQLGVYNLRGTALPVEQTETSAGSEFDRTVVLLEGAKSTQVPPQTVTIEQHNTRFEPDLVVIPVGSTVQFPNGDPVFHNVFSLSGAQPFDLGYYPQSQSRSVKFSKSGIVQVYCHIHSNMYAAIVVTDSPWYGKPAADGSFSWTHVPSGHYRVIAWHKVAGLFRTEVDVPESGVAHVTIRVPVDVER
jgi:plastocyanin